MIRIILIRHGHTAWNVGKGAGNRFRGTVDIPLAEEGVAQAQLTAQRLVDQPLAALYASPLQRASRTAEIIAEPHGLAVETLPGLSSMDYGDWAGKRDTEVARDWPDVYAQWLRDPFSIQVPGGESTADLRERIMAALYDILSRHSSGETIALVSHQAVIRSLVCSLAGMPNTAWTHFGMDLCSLTLFDYDPSGGTFVLAGLNDTCHLSPALPRGKSGGTRLILIRHGQTAWNAGAGEERFRGRTDLVLDDLGQAQARAVSVRLKDEAIAAIYASPLLRTQQTIEPLARRLNLALDLHPGLIDINYGKFQGLSHSEAAKTVPDLYASWRTNPGQVHFPDGECLTDVQNRLRALLDEMVTRHPGETVVLAGHQIVNKVLACTLLGLDLDEIWRVEQDTASINIYQPAKGVWHALCLNDTCHLQALAPHDDGRCHLSIDILERYHFAEGPVRLQFAPVKVGRRAAVLAYAGMDDDTAASSPQPEIGKGVGVAIGITQRPTKHVDQPDLPLFKMNTRS